MASLKDLIVSGKTRVLGYVYGNKFITDGGTDSQFVKGDGTLDDNNYITTSLANSNYVSYIWGNQNYVSYNWGNKNYVSYAYAGQNYVSYKWGNQNYVSYNWGNKNYVSYAYAGQNYVSYKWGNQNYVSYNWGNKNYVSYEFLINQAYINTLHGSKGSNNVVSDIYKNTLNNQLEITYSTFPTYQYNLQNYVSYAYFNQIIEEDEYIVAQSLSIFSDYFNNSSSYDGLTNFTRTNVIDSNTNASYLKITTTKNEKGVYLPIATNLAYGLIKLKGSSNSLTTSNLTLTNTTQIYPIAKTKDGFVYAGVPWTYIKGFSAVGSTTASDGSITLSYYYSNSHSGASSGTVTLPTPHYAETAPWSGITGKPTTFTPSTHNHDNDYVKKIGDTMTGALNINLARSTSIYPLKMLTSTAMSANDISSILLGSANSTGNAASISFKYAGANNNSNLLSLGFVGATNLINVLRNGNVGIGTTSPDTTLRVEGAIKSKSIYPIDSHSYSLGMSTRAWRNAFISGFGGNIAPSNLVFSHMYNSQSPSMSYWESSDSSVGLRGLGKLYTDYRFGNKIAGLPLSAITVKVSNEDNDNEDTWDDITTNESTNINYNTIIRILRNFYTENGLIPGKTPVTVTDSGTNKTPLTGSTDYDRISIILDFTVENRVGYVDVINMFIRNYSRTCKFSIEYMTTASYNSSQTWTILYEKQFSKIDAGLSANQTIYLTQGLYMNGNNTTDTADTSNHYIRISKLKFKYISTDRIHTTDTVSSLANEGLTITSTNLTKRQNELRYAPLIGNFAVFGAASLSLNAATASGNNKNPCTTGLSRILEQRDVPYLISIYDGIRYGNSTTPYKTDIYMGKITFPANIYISDDYTYAFANVDKNVTVTIGNSASISSYNNHCSGKIRLYSQASNYVDILSQSTGSNTIFYLPNAGSSTYAVHRTTNNSAIGSSTKSIYIAANGKIEEGSEFAVSGHNHDDKYISNIGISGNNLSYIKNNTTTNLTIPFATSSTTATQLASSVTIWGQSFNGTAPVSGNMTGVGSIAASGNITTTITTASALKVSVKNYNGEIGIHVETNKGLYDYTKSKWVISTGGSATYTFLGLGNVGIGTTSTPTRKLEVNGAIHANTYITSTTYIKSGAAVEATTYVRAIGNDIYAGSASGSQCHMQFNDTTKTLHFIFD